MKIFRAYKIELKPNTKQQSYFVRCAETALFVWNVGLREWQCQYKEGRKPSAFALKKQFNAIKYDQFPNYFSEGSVPYTIVEAVFENLGGAYKNFFRRVKAGEKPGFPKFKSRRNGLSSFSLRGSILVERGRIRLPLVGWIRLKEKDYLPTDAKILKVTISERAERWFISMQVEIEIRDPLPKKGRPLGIDVGISNSAVLSNGKLFRGVAVLRKYERKLARLQRELSRRTKGGQSWKKTKQKIAKLHLKISNVRKHDLHNVSAYTMKCRPSTVVIEDLNVAGMMQNRHLSKSIGDASMSELHRQIRYKSEWNGIELKIADRWYPSTKLCSRCGEISDITLDQRVYLCEKCGLEIGRDRNAARNLAALAEAPNGRGLPVELALNQEATVKQEVGMP